MSEETKTEKSLKLEMAFGEAATAELERQKALGKLASNEELFVQALRVHGWFLDNKSNLFIRNGEEMLKVTLEL